jgi:regulator of sigma E protease
MAKPNESSNKLRRAIVAAVVFAAIVYYIVQNFGWFGNVVLVLLGFGTVVLVHEFGHFVAAKLSGMKVEAFSIGFPPTLAGIRRTEHGYQIRVLPGLFRSADKQADNCLLSATVGRGGPAWDTEYRVGLIPVGGYVKLLGQDDIGPTKSNDDQRSFANKPATTRAAVLSAGVIFNAISAIVVFMIVFLVGIELNPPIVGEVLPNSPAARAGLRPGDEIVEIAGKKGSLDFSDIGIAAALSGKNEEVPVKVRHRDGSEQEFSLVAEQKKGESLRQFGVAAPLSLTIARIYQADANEFLGRTGLHGGDRVRSVGGLDVRSHWELMEVVEGTLEPSVSITAERGEGKDTGRVVEGKVGLEWLFAESYEVGAESELYHIYSMVPRLWVTAVASGAAESGRPGGLLRRLKAKVFSSSARQSDQAEQLGPPLQTGDVILAIGEVENPTYSQMREVTVKYEGKVLPVRVLRRDKAGVEQVATVMVKPRRIGKKGDEDGNVVIGITVALDAAHAVVAKTIECPKGPARLEIPSGAVITAVDGTAVSSFYDVAREIRKNKGQRITIDYRLDDETAGAVALDAADPAEAITVKSALVEYIPFSDLRVPYKANGPVEAVVMGWKRTVTFIAQTYVTLRRLLSGLVGPENLMGPIGIIAFSYRIVAEQPMVYYVYFLGLISAVIAVFNFLPLPPFDGGLVVLLVVEKIKGSAVSERVQGVLIYTGWVLVLMLFLYVTFNDIVVNFFG